MRSLFWPNKRNPSATLVGWLGRVFHWSATALAVVLIAFAGVLFMGGAMVIDVDMNDEMNAKATGLLIGAIGVFVAGRVVRRVLSAE